MIQAGQVNSNLFKIMATKYFTRDSQVGHKIPKNELMQGDLLFSLPVCKATPPSAWFLLCSLIPASGERHYLLNLFWVLKRRVCIEMHV